MYGGVEGMNGTMISLRPVRMRCDFEGVGG
jgi:hypothetical protein